MNLPALTNIRIIFHLLLSLIFITSAYTQDNFILNGQVIGEDSLVLQDVLVYSDSGASSITNEKGVFTLTLSEMDSVSLHFKYLGYEDKDTLMMLDGLSESFINISLTRSNFDLPEITISEKQVNLFDKKDWVILSFEIYESNFFLLALEDNKTYLYRATLNGIFTAKTEVDKASESLHLSALGGLHLIGKKKCQQIEFREGNLEFVNAYPRSKFDKLLSPALAKIGDTVIFEQYGVHNKSIQYFYYKNQEEVLLYNVYDEAATKGGHQYYKEIIQLYHRTVNTQDPNDIDYGMIRTNIISEGIWNGELVDLAISYGLMVKIMYYEHIVCSEINSSAFMIDDRIYIFDRTELELAVFNENLQLEKAITLDNKLWEKHKNNLLQDRVTQEVYLVSKKRKLSQFSLNKNLVHLDYVVQLPDLGYYERDVIVHNSSYYCISNYNGGSPFTKMSRFKLPMLTEKQ